MTTPGDNNIRRMEEEEQQKQNTPQHQEPNAEITLIVKGKSAKDNINGEMRNFDFLSPSHPLVCSVPHSFTDEMTAHARERPTTPDGFI